MIVTLSFMAVIGAVIGSWLFTQKLGAKPWLEQGVEVDVRGAESILPTPKMGLVVFLTVATALFAMLCSGYYMRLKFADWSALPEPPLLWFNTGLLILGSIVLRNPQGDPVTGTQVSSESILFRAKDASIDEKLIRPELTDPAGNPLDLFEDLVHDGQVEVVVQCLELGQYFGVAQADCYLRLEDGWFAANLFKGYVSIWVQMVLIAGVGVMCSTILSGPVAMMFTLSILMLGFYKDFIISVAVGETQGGGPIESLVRLITQRNLTQPMGEGTVTLMLMQGLDGVSLIFMRAFASMMPDFRNLSTVGHVIGGFNISTTLVAQHLTICLAYLVGLFVVGYFLLRSREVAK